MSWKFSASSLAAKAKSAAVSTPQFGKGAAKGIYKGAESLVTGVASAVKSAGTFAYKATTDKPYRDRAVASASRSASQAKDYAQKLATSPEERQRAYDGAKGFVVQTKDRFVAARDKARAEGRISEFYGEVVGRGAFELLPVSKLGAVGKLGKAGKVANATSKGTTAARVTKAKGVSQAVKAKSTAMVVAPCPKAGLPMVIPKPKPMSLVAAKKLAAQTGNSAQHRQAREQVARAFYASRGSPRKLRGHEKSKWGWKSSELGSDRPSRAWNASDIEAHVAGIDLSQPVAVRTVTKGSGLYQHSKPGEIGEYFTLDPRITPDALGVNSGVLLERVGTTPPRIVQRQLTHHIVRQDVTVLESTAAPIVDNFSIPHLPKTTNGGGKQLHLPKDAHWIIGQ